MTPKVLVVLTSHDKIDATGNPTGWFLVCNNQTPHYNVSKRERRLTVKLARIRPPP
jgi:hypothetical protein